MDLSPLKIDRSASSGGPQPAASESTTTGRIVLVIGLVVAAFVAWLFFPAIKARIDRVRLPSVRVVPVERQNAVAQASASGMAANGYVVAARRAALSADAPGRIVEMRVTEGQVVRKGEVVARLYSDEVAAALRRAEADVVAATAAQVRAQAAVASAQAEVERLASGERTAAAQLAAAEAEVQLARQSFARQEELSRRGVSTGADLDQARMSIDRATAQVEAFRAARDAARSALEAGRAQTGVAEADVAVSAAQVRVAEAGREQAQASLFKLEVRAPFDGVVVLKDAEVGEVVSPMSQGGSARGSVVTMVDFESLEVQCDVPETSLSAVRKGGAVKVYLDAYPSRTYRGKVDRIWPTANRQKATVEVRCELLGLDLPGGEAQRVDLRPEMGVRVVFLAEGGAPEPEPTAGAQAGPPPLLVPTAALTNVGGRPGVFVVERNVAKFRAVETPEGAGGGASVQVTSGLEVGERVVVDPPVDLADGDRVLLIE